MKSINVRDEQAPEKLVLLRLGVNTLNDTRLARSCEESFARMGVHAFSVFGLPPGGYEELARLVPVFVHRPKFLEAIAEEVVAAGFALLPTNAEPHWSVILPEPTPAHFDRVRSLFRGPIKNPVWIGPGAT